MIPSLTFSSLFWWSALAISLPIIIHLLARRKFRVVDWAAMDFLLEANRRNRRRVLLENLLLLLLRCLAILLLAWMIARPILNPSTLAMVGAESSVERIVILDDSVSMQVRPGGENETSIEIAKKALVEFVERNSRERSEDTFTLIMTSDPRHPLVNGQHLRDENTAQIVETIKQIKPSSSTAKLDDALAAVEQEIQRDQEKQNRAIYVVTDLRQRDWKPDAEGDATKNPSAIVGRLSESENVQAVAVLDLGSDETKNLYVTKIESRSKTLVSGVRYQFQVTVKNAGEDKETDVELEFTAGGGTTLRKTIAEIDAGAEVTEDFRFTFDEPGSFRVVANLPGADKLEADNQRYFSARVLQGRRILIVDGHRSFQPDQSESFYIERAIAPRGEYLSGNLVEIATDNQFESLDLSDYQVIFLCNVFQIPESRKEALEEWVANGGGLMISTGDQVDAAGYAEFLNGKDADGLMPIAFGAVKGDKKAEKWVQLVPRALNHPALTIFSGELTGVFTNAESGIKVFQYHACTVDPEILAAGQVRVLATWSDADDSPALVEKAFGDGKVILQTSSIDADWTNWPASQSFAAFFLDLVEYVAPNTSGMGNLTVGEPIEHRVNPTRFREDLTIVLPAVESQIDKEPLQALPDEGKQNLIAKYEKVDRNGFYELQLARYDEGSEKVLYAANIHETEGNLERVDLESLKEKLAESEISIQPGMTSLTLGDEGAWSKLWKYALALALIVLFGEQLLAWAFGRRRGG